MSKSIFDPTNRSSGILRANRLADSKGTRSTPLLPRLRRIFVRFCVAFTIVILIAQFSPLTPWYAGKLAEGWPTPSHGVLIVLTADEQSDGIIGTVSYWRAVYAVRAWNSGHFSAVVISGGYMDGNKISLAASVGRFLVAYGVPANKIFLEDRSTSTRENALFTKQMVASWPGQKVLLTSEFHMFRARRTFEAVGLHVIPYPFPHALKQWNNPVNHLPVAFGLAYETAKTVRYWTLGWVHLF